MAKKLEPTPRLSDEERHARFVAMAREVGASEDSADFERAFKRVAPAKAPPNTD